MQSLAFQRAVLRCLPECADLTDYLLADDADLTPDPLALHEDIAHASRLRGNADPANLAGFVGSIARSAGDDALERAAGAGMAHQGKPLAARLEAAPPPL